MIVESPVTVINETYSAETIKYVGVIFVIHVCRLYIATQHRYFAT